MQISNHLNSFLIVLSAIIAWNLPFELFLFSYAILGPLHYFTEISWLHDRNYFCQTKAHSLPLYLIAGLNFILVVFLNNADNTLLFIGFCLAFLTLVTQSWRPYMLLSLILIPVCYWLVQYQPVHIIFVAFLPTIIHVSVFTFLFMLYGSLKNNSVSGYVSVMIYLLGVMFIFIMPESNNYQVNQNTFEIIDPFIALANQISTLLDREVTSQTLLSSFRFLAFIYTFHYLNWFIKIKTIAWFDISRNRLAMILVAWILSISIYFYDFKLGLITLFFFSVTHVLLEFPLNFISMRGLAYELFIREKGKIK